MIGKYRTAFAHGDVVRRVKAQCCNVAKGAHHLATVGSAQRIAAVFNQPQVVLFAERGDHVEVERVAQRMGQHDGFGFGRNGSFYLAGVDIVGEPVHINKNRHRAKLNDRVDGGWKACRHANDFIAALDGPVAQLGRG